MSERVVFRPSGTESAIPFTTLGQVPGGAWGIVDDQAWFGASGGDSLELLFLTRADYLHAVRGLSAQDLGPLVENRRRTFASQIPGIALGVVELFVRQWIGALGTGDSDAGVRGDLLTALASFTTVPRFADTAVPTLLDHLREGDARIIVELDSPSLRAAGDLDPNGDERATRRRFATDIGTAIARPGQPEARSRVLPHVDIERAYLLTPVPADIEEAAHSFHDPAMHFRGGLIVPIPEREIPQLVHDGHEATVVFPTRGQLSGALAGMTDAEIGREVNERLRVPGFGAYLRALRLQQATLRTAAWLIAGGDVGILGLLAEQVREETSKLGSWLAFGAPSPNAGSVAATSTAALDAATFLVALCRLRGELTRAGGLEALARALSQIAAKPKT